MTDTGKRILTTTRCVVRELAAADMDALFRLYEPPSITRFVEPLFERDREEVYQRNYRELVYGRQGFGLWAVEERATGELIGRIGVERLDGLPPDTVELGYLIAEEKQRQGYATEVCRAVLLFTKERLGFSNVQAHVHPDNTASVALMRKLGFTETHEERDGERIWRKRL